MQPEIKMLSKKKLIGKKLTMTFSDNQTFRLWQSFMPRRNEVKNAITKDLFSVQEYPEMFDFTFLKYDTPFQKWATVEVSDFENIPDNMETLVLTGGLYAVFHYKGLNTDTTIFEYIFKTWLSDSDYTIDHRPHFEILGEKYKNNDPDSEEEIWIPIKKKS